MLERIVKIRLKDHLNTIDGLHDRQYEFWRGVPPLLRRFFDTKNKKKKKIVEYHSILAIREAGWEIARDDHQIPVLIHTKPLPLKHSTSANCAVSVRKICNNASELKRHLLSAKPWTHVNYYHEMGVNGVFKHNQLVHTID